MYHKHKLMMLVSFGVLIAICLTFGNAQQCKPKPQKSNRDVYVVKSVMSFEDFVQKFHKTYTNPAEALVHHKLFLARSMRATVSGINYKHGRTGYYLGVNHMSDMTPDELSLRFRRIGSSDYMQSGLKEAGAQNSVISQNIEAVYDLNNNNLVHGQSKGSDKSRDEIYTDLGDMDQNHSYSNDDIENECEIPDEVFIDWRKNGCFNSIRDQFNCASCYIMSALAIWEYVHCIQTGELVQFSPQYIIDCGPRRGLEGCDGGLAWELNPFMQDYGLDLELNYPYKAMNDTCPYGDTGNDDQLGYYKVSNSGMIVFSVPDIDIRLQKTPVVYSIVTPANLIEYAGGVLECMLESRYWGHAMVIVGSGREDGKDYWLFMNSWGEHWGINGYMKLNKNNTCMQQSAGAAPKALIYGVDFIEGLNKQYNAKPIMDRFDQN